MHLVVFESLKWQFSSKLPVPFAVFGTLIPKELHEALNSLINFTDDPRKIKLINRFLRFLLSQKTSTLSQIIEDLSTLNSEPCQCGAQKTSFIDPTIPQTPLKPPDDMP